MSYLFFLATYGQNDFVLKPIVPSRTARQKTPDETGVDSIDTELRNVTLPTGFLSRMADLAHTLPED